MLRGQSEGTNLRQQTRLWDSYPAKSPNLRQHQACSQNKGLSRASRLQAGPSPSGDRQARAVRARKGATVAPKRHHLPQRGIIYGQARAARARRGQLWPQRGIIYPREASCYLGQQASLLTKTSWDSGRSTFAGRVAAREQLPRRDTWHT